jgi:hypothetical protein
VEQVFLHLLLPQYLLLVELDPLVVLQSPPLHLLPQLFQFLLLSLRFHLLIQCLHLLLHLRHCPGRLSRLFLYHLDLTTTANDLIYPLPDPLHVHSRHPVVVVFDVEAQVAILVGESGVESNGVLGFVCQARQLLMA